MTEQQEIKIVKIITSNCTPIFGTKTDYDGGYCILDIFEMVKDIDDYYKRLERDY